MKITEITYSKGQTLQLKQFEPTNVHFSVKAEVAENDDLEMAYEELKLIVDRQVVSKLAELKKSTDLPF